MLECFLKRREALLSQVEALEKQSKAAPDDQTREEIDARAWLIVARIELYRNAGPLAFFDHPQRARSYLEYLRKDLTGTTTASELELLDEVGQAFELLRVEPDTPLF